MIIKYNASKTNNTTDELLTDLKKALDDETNKPLDQWDEKVIMSISSSIVTIKGYRLTEKDIKRGKEKILAGLDKYLNAKEIRRVDRERIS